MARFVTLKITALAVLMIATMLANCQLTFQSKQWKPAGKRTLPSPTLGTSSSLTDNHDERSPPSLLELLKDSVSNNSDESKSDIHAGNLQQRSSSASMPKVSSSLPKDIVRRLRTVCSALEDFQPKTTGYSLFL